MFKIRNTRLESIMFKGCGTVPITAFAQDGSLTSLFTVTSQRLESGLRSISL